ncbi:MAG: hypothetical protein ACM3Q4_04565 [Acidobacteriota bacterium]
MEPKPDKLMPALYGGLVIAAFWAVPGLNLINCFCCAGVIFGGMLAVFLYARSIRPEMPPLTMNDCLRVGLLAGVIASVAAVAINVAVSLVFGNVAIEMMERIIMKMRVEMPAEFQQMVEEAKQQRISPVGAFFSIFVYLIPNALFSALGGLIGWSLFRPKLPSEE